MIFKLGEVCKMWIYVDLWLENNFKYHINLVVSYCLRFGRSTKKTSYWWRDIITLFQVIDNSALTANHGLNSNVMKVRMMERLLLFLKFSNESTQFFLIQYVLFGLSSLIKFHMHYLSYCGMLILLQEQGVDITKKDVRQVRNSLPLIVIFFKSCWMHFIKLNYVAV